MPFIEKFITDRSSDAPSAGVPSPAFAAARPRLARCRTLTPKRVPITISCFVIMKIHEYQAKAILTRHGVPVPRGEVAFSGDEAAAAAGRLGGVVVVKAQ